MAKIPKHLLSGALSLLLVFPALIPAAAIIYAEETRVCGNNKETYPNLDYAEKNHISISYDFPCAEPPSLHEMYERTEKLKIAGAVTDYYLGKSGTIMQIKANRDQRSLVVAYPSSGNQKDHYLPGDQVLVDGLLNKNTGLITADRIVNLSAQDRVTGECDIAELYQDTIHCDSEKGAYTLNVDTSTRFVAGLSNPATISHFSKGDKLMTRSDTEMKAQIVILKKRGEKEFLRSHVFIAQASHEGWANGKFLIKFQSLPEEISWIRNCDECELSIESARSVRKYYGELDWNMYHPGDKLYIIGRAADDGSLEALSIKNETQID